MQTSTRFTTKSLALLLAGVTTAAAALAAAQPQRVGAALGGLGLASFGARVFTHLSDAFTPGAVPEPSTYALLATGVVGLAGALIRRRHGAV